MSASKDCRQQCASNLAARSIFGLLVIALVWVPSTMTTAYAANNVALGRPYTVQPAPTYGLTKDDDDLVQLTDGTLAPDTIWTSRKTVGWMASSEPISIEVDLGRARSIERVCIRSARRKAAGVQFPRRIDIFNSLDRNFYSWLGDVLAGQDTTDGPYLAKRFCSKKLSATGRYLRMLVSTRGPFFFSDEVEIFGSDIPAGAAPAHPDSLARDQLRSFTVQQGAVTDLVKRAGQNAGTSSARDTLIQLERRLADTSGRLDFATLALIEKDLRQALREDTAQSCKVSVCAIRVDPWRRWASVERPVPVANGDLDVRAGEHAAIAISIQHSGAAPINVVLAAEPEGPLKGVLKARLFEAALVTRANGIRQADPLVPLLSGRVEVGVGESKQIWIDLQAPFANEAHDIVNVSLDSGGVRLPSIDIPVHVWPARKPRRPPSTVVWGYLDAPPVRGLERQASTDMLSHGVTTAVLPPQYLPWPNDPAAGSAAAVADYRHFDDTLTILHGHQQVLFFLAFNSESLRRSFGGRHAFLSPAWATLFQRWVREWSSHLLQTGYGYETFAFYPMDEPQNESQTDALIAVARLIKEVDPRIRVYTTLHIAARVTDALIEAVDIFQLNGRSLNENLIGRLKSRGKTVWSYSTEGGGKAGDPMTFYRAQGWEAFQLGLSGFGFWSYNDVGRVGTAWNDIDGDRPDYAVIYEGPDSIFSSKRWEAWREGVQDFNLLSEAMANARDDAQRSNVRRLAAQGLRNISDGPSLAKVRRQLLEMSQAVKGSGGAAK